jgi:outer membrane protein TolC
LGVIEEILLFNLMSILQVRKQLVLVLILMFLADLSPDFLAMAQTVSNANDVVELKLNDYIQQVIAQNELVQAQMLEAEASHHKARGEMGVFEPVLQASVTREANARTNNTEQQAAQGGASFFSEQNTIYDGGVQELIPLGGTVRLGANLSDLDNNINPYGSILTETNTVFTRQYQAFVGATITQPLLKDFGLGPTLAAIRLAAIDSDIAFQQYRKQLMLVISRAESAYWNVYFAQEQLRFFDDSVKVAQNVLDDSRQKLNAGQGSELDVMDAQSGLALRQTKRNEAFQSYLEALGMMRSLSGVSPMPYEVGPGGPNIRVVDLPPKTNAPISYADSYWRAYASNPDFLIQKEKMRQEEVRLGVAKSQALPELDLKAAYGYNGLGNTPARAWQVAEAQSFPSWSVGLELTFPLDGNIKARNLKKAAQLSLQKVPKRSMPTTSIRPSRRHRPGSKASKVMKPSFITTRNCSPIRWRS